MAGGFVEELLIKFGVVPDKKSFEEASSSLDKLVDRAKDFAKELLALEGVKMLGELVMGVAENAERLSLASQELGVGVEELQKYEYAAKLAGVSTGELDLSLRFLLRNMSQASEGSKEASKGFSQLGISVKGANGHVKTVEEALPEIADKFQKIEDPAKRVRIAMELFGRSGARIIPFLIKGPKGLKDLGDEAEAFGSVLTKEQTEIGEGFLHNVRAIGAFFQGIKNTVGLSLIKTLGDVVKVTREWMKVNGSLVRQRIGEFFTVLGKTIAGVAQLMVPLLHGIGLFIDALFKLSPVLAFTTIALAGLALAFGAASIEPILIALAVGVLLVALEDLYQFFTGGKSVTGHVVKSIERMWEAWTEPHPGESALMTQIRKEAVWITEIIKNITSLIKHTSLFSGSLDLVGKDLDKIGGNLSPIGPGSFAELSHQYDEKKAGKENDANKNASKKPVTRESIFNQFEDLGNRSGANADALNTLGINPGAGSVLRDQPHQLVAPITIYVTNPGATAEQIGEVASKHVEGTWDTLMQSAHAALTGVTF